MVRQILYSSSFLLLVVKCDHVTKETEALGTRMVEMKLSNTEQVCTVSRQNNKYYSLRFFYSGGFPELDSLFSVLIVKRSFKVLLFLLAYVLKRGSHSRDARLADFIFC